MPYLPSQPSGTVSPRPALRFLLARLRKCGVEEELFDDAHVLDHFNEAYQRACERSLCLQAIATIALTSAQEYALPGDHHETLSVYLNGYPLERLQDRDALMEGLLGYYEYGKTIGFRPTPSTNGSAYVLYARTPPELATLDASPEDGFVPEVYDALVHYVRHKRYTSVGGAERIRQAQWEREQFELGVRRLAQAARRLDSNRHTRLVHVASPRRRKPTYARGVDAG